MNFVVYCHIFPHICIILVVITNVPNDFGDFLNNPLSSGFNSVWQKTPSVSIFDFSGGGKRSWEEQKRWAGAPTPLGRATRALSAFRSPFRFNFHATDSSWPKTDYIRFPRHVSWIGGGVDRKHIKRESAGRRRRRSEGGTAAGIASGWLHPPPARASSTPSHLPLFNLLANMMCEAIYHFPMMYCTSMSLFE